MRQKHKRALYGYSTKSVERATETLQLSYQKSRQALESELAEYNRNHIIVSEEIVLRKQELIEHAGMEKELDGILQQAHLESVKQSRINEFQEPISLAGKKAK